MKFNEDELRDLLDDHRARQTLMDIISKAPSDTVFALVVDYPETDTEPSYVQAFATGRATMRDIVYYAHALVTTHKDDTDDEGDLA